MSGADAYERWPGYNEQSWAERFAELDRRYARMTQQLVSLSQLTLKALAQKETER